MPSSFRRILGITVSVFALHGTAQAAGFYIQEQSVSALGTANAGAVADTQDASTIFFNPAGMTELDGMEATGGVHVIIPSAELNDNGSTVAGNPIGGNDGGDPYDVEAVPNFYFAYPLSSDRRWWAGIGVSAPFGLANKYNDGFFGRYNSTENHLQTKNIAPSIAWAATDWFSVGGGIDVQYVDAKLENAIPSPISPGTLSTDGLTDLSGDDLTVGYNAGVIIKPFAGTKIGAHYRQGISHTLQGRVVNRIPSDVPGTGGTVVRVPGEAELDLPAIATLGFSHFVTNDLQILGHVAWHEWSNFDDIPVVTTSGFTSTTQNYNNSWAFAAGLRYQLTPDWQLKAGIQFDETPSVDGFRSTRIPDGDRRWVAGGATWNVNGRWLVDFAGVYIDVDKEEINLSETNGVTSVAHTVDATSEGDIGIVSAAIRRKF